jgi:prefoldin subunit 5
LSHREAELTELSVNFNTLASQLKEAQEQLQLLTTHTTTAADCDEAILFAGDQLLSDDLRKNLMQEQLEREAAQYEDYENAISELQQELEVIRQENEELKTDKISLTDEIANMSQVPFFSSRSPHATSLSSLVAPP